MPTAPCLGPRSAQPARGLAWSVQPNHWPCGTMTHCQPTLTPTYMAAIPSFWRCAQVVSCSECYCAHSFGHLLLLNYLCKHIIQCLACSCMNPSASICRCCTYHTCRCLRVYSAAVMIIDLHFLSSTHNCVNWETRVQLAGVVTAST